MARARVAARPRIHLRSLNGKFLLILAAVALGGAVALTLLLTAVITPSFATLERQSIEARVERVDALLDSHGGKIEDAVLTARDAIARHGDAIAHPLSDGSILEARVPAGSGIAPARLTAALHRLPLARIVGTAGVGHFYLSGDHGIDVVGVARAAGDDDGAGHYVATARHLDAGQLGRALGLAVKIAPPDGSGAVATVDAETMRIAVPVRGASGRPVAAITFATPRTLAMLGRHVLWLAVGTTTVLLVVMLIVLRRMMTLLVMRPLRRVEAHMEQVRDSGAFLPLEDDGRSHDEIASLGHSFNSMLAQLKDLSERVETQSFALGRTESAVAVMHNVRNALTPVTTILGISLNEMEPADRHMIGRALSELGDPGTAPERRSRLIDFITAAFAAEDRMRAERRDQLRLGRDAMSQVLEIIGAQQALAHTRPALELCDATQIVAQNAVIARHSADGNSIALSFPARPHPVVANRLLLSQVIGNLLSNAVDAIEAVGGTGTIAVTIEERCDGMVEIAIRDDGEGFDPADTPLLFQRGFSTRAHKSGGLGLHWCANSVGSMDGSLRLESDGEARGAVARLALPGPAGAASSDNLAA